MYGRVVVAMFAGAVSAAAQVPGAASPPRAHRGAAVIILQLADSTASTLTDSTRERSIAGTASIPALLFDAPLAPGTDTLRDLPEGVWSVRIRALGFEPRTVSLRASPSSSRGAAVVIRLVPFVRTLNAVNVVARHDQKVLDGIDERMRVASGTLIRAGDPFLATATEPTDALRAGRGFLWRSPTEIETFRSNTHCKSLNSNTPAMKDLLAPHIVFYLDGVRVPGGPETLNNIIRPNDILAIETYPEVLSAPFLWRTADACAVVAFWTRHRVKDDGT